MSSRLALIIQGNIQIRIMEIQGLLEQDILDWKKRDLEIMQTSRMISDTMLTLALPLTFQYFLQMQIAIIQILFTINNI